MSWIEDAKKLYSDLEAFEKERPHRLFLTTEADIPCDFSEIKSIFVRFDSDPSVVKALPQMIRMATNLKTLSIFSEELSWDEICELDLHRIEKLSFCYKGRIGSRNIIAPLLQELDIYSDNTLAPLEQMLEPVSTIDFSGIPLLEGLRLNNVQTVNPSDFSGLQHLNRLRINNSNIHNLDFLKDASYKLDYFLFNDSVVDYSGLIWQQNIIDLILPNPHLQDASLFLLLPKLRYLDLRYMDSLQGDDLRSRIETVLITRRDGDYAWIKRKVHDLVRYAVNELRSENKRIDKTDELPRLRRKVFLERISQPFEKRIIYNINFEYRRAIASMEKPEFKGSRSFNKEEYLSIYKKEALQYLPFLSEPN